MHVLKGLLASFWHELFYGTYAVLPLGADVCLNSGRQSFSQMEQNMQTLCKNSSKMSIECVAHNQASCEIGFWNLNDQKIAQFIMNSALQMSGFHKCKGDLQ